MRPHGVIPTAGAVYQIARDRRLQAERGTLVACEVCGRDYAPRITFDVRYGKRPAQFTGGKTCSSTCAERARAKATT